MGYRAVQPLLVVARQTNKHRENTNPNPDRMRQIFFVIHLSNMREQPMKKKNLPTIPEKTMCCSCSCSTDSHSWRSRDQDPPPPGLTASQDPRAVPGAAGGTPGGAASARRTVHGRLYGTAQAQRWSSSTRNPLLGGGEKDPWHPGSGPGVFW